METDIAVIQIYVNGEWEDLIYIGPDREGGRFDQFENNIFTSFPFQIIALSDLRIKYYPTNEREY